MNSLRRDADIWIPSNLNISAIESGNVNGEWLSQQMKELGERISILLQYAHADSTQQLDLLPEALEELGASLEELRVSQEVLHQQNQELLEAHMSLEAERKRYRELFEFAPDGYLITDTNGKIQEANHAASVLLNLPQQYLIGKPFSRFISRCRRRVFWHQLEHLHQTERLQEWITQLQPHHAPLFDAALTATAVYDQSDTLVGLRWLVRDITERKQLEAAQLRATVAEMTNQALEAEIARRQQLEQELRQQTKSLHQANTLKDEFLAIVSHELRSPLNAMLGWTQMLRSRQLEEAIAARALETIERNARAQSKLIEDLLDISCIVRGNLHLNIGPVNLATVIQDTIDSVQLALTAKNIEIRTVIDESAGLISGDPDRLQQVIWNLLSNAIKFTPRHGGIEVRLERIASSAAITVSDTGQGIHSDFLPYVFDRFRQAERATTRHHGGLGLGLAIVRQLVEMHGGTVSVSSSGEGQGASFRVQIPMMAVRLLPEISPPIAEAAAFEQYASLNNVQVLVVDDEADTRDLLTTVLEQAGANVKTAASVNEALQVLQQSPPHILISDVGMPEQDGYVLINHLRRSESAQPKTIPAIALTAYAREEDRQQLLSAGFQLHLSKPVEPAALVAAVASQIGA